MAFCSAMECSRFAGGTPCESCKQPFCSNCDKAPERHPCKTLKERRNSLSAEIEHPKHHAESKEPTVPFDDILGVTSGVAVYSNGSDVFFSGERMYVDGIYSGFKWQCVEFARRWLLGTKGCQFAEVLRASEIWLQSTLRHVETGATVPLRQCPNGGKDRPSTGTLIIYPYEEKRTPWGHVGVITFVCDDYVGIAEQNYVFTKWHQGEEYGRRVPITRTAEGGFYLHEEEQPPCLGWMVPEIADRDSKEPLKVLPEFIAVQQPGRLTRRAVAETFVDLDLTLRSHALYAKTRAAKIPWSAIYDMDERKGTDGIANTNRTLRLIEKTLDHMISRREDLREVPTAILERACQSWIDHRSFATYARIDFAFDGRTEKLVRVALDSLDCALVCPLQDDWFRKVTGKDVPFSLSQYKSDWTQVWHHVLSKTGAKTVYFVDTSDDDEQRFNALSLFESTGKSEIPCQWLELNDLKVTQEAVFAPDGTQIRVLFKTCPWTSVLSDVSSQRARLLLHPTLLVLEPLWKALVPDNFLSVLERLNPGVELMRRAGFEWKEKTAGRYPTTSIVLVGGKPSAQLIADNADDKISTLGPFAAMCFDVLAR